MKHFLTFASLISLFLAACGTAGTSTVSTAPAVVPTFTQMSLPVVKVDQAHMDTAGLNYIIPAGDGFVFDASAFQFKLNGQVVPPTALQVIVSSRAYQGTWTVGATSQVVHATELTPLAKGQATLTQFESGMQLIVSIGTLNTYGHYQSLWVAVVSVQ